MFTGLVEFTGRLAVRPDGRQEGPERESAAMLVECGPLAGDAEVGDSIAVDGVCLTVTGRENGVLRFDLSEETLERTTFGHEPSRARVNLERPVTLATRLGGHLVQGHVDGVGTVEAVEPEGQGGSGGESSPGAPSGRAHDRERPPRGEGGVRMTVRVPDGLDRYLVEKGSVAVDGVSLTVAGLGEGTFDVALIPHTLAETTLGERAPGDPVNLEMDVLAKYVERLIRRDG